MTAPVGLEVVEPPCAWMRRAKSRGASCRAPKYRGRSCSTSADRRSLNGSRPACVPVSSPGKSVHSTLAALWDPSEPRIANGAVEWIDIDYPEARVDAFGVGLNWLVWFFGISILAALALRKRFGVVI